MPECTAAREDRFSAALARLAFASAALLLFCALGAWLAHANLPEWAWVCVWPDAAALVLWLLLRVLPSRCDPRLAPRRA